MKRSALFAVALVLALSNVLLGEIPTTQPIVEPLVYDQSFAVVVSKSTFADPDWNRVAVALAEKHSGSIIVFEGDVSNCLSALKSFDPRYAAFVAKPQEAGRRFVMHVSQVTRQLNDDPYGDVIWGIVTGYTAADAMRVASVNQPLVLNRAGAGTAIPLAPFQSGKWFSESKAGEYTTKSDGAEPIKSTDGPTDSTAEIVNYFNTANPDLFVTSGHASERGWALGYTYKNGALVSRQGKIYGVDLNRQLHPVDSKNPKVFMAVGNCLMGHIDGGDSMALGWMGSAGVDQFVGYTVVTWYGAMGWGINDYLFGLPGEHDLAESFYLSNQALIHRLVTEYPNALHVNLDLPEKDGSDPDAAIQSGFTLLDQQCGPLTGKSQKDRLGLVWDRDVVVFYGDPLWDARLAPSGTKVSTTLQKKSGVYYFTAVASENYKPGKPIAMLLPHRLQNINVTGGEEFKPLVAGNFVMLCGLETLEKNKPYEVMFTADDATPELVSASSTSAAVEGSKAQLAKSTEGPDVSAVVPLLPEQYRHRLVQQLSLAEENESALLQAIVDTKPEHRQAIAYLLLNMPEKDLKTITGKYLIDNIELAYQAREATAWGRAVPNEIFFQDVLPYASTDEPRDDWRRPYFDQFMPLVKDAKTTGEAAQILNRKVFPAINVKYNAQKRNRPIQSPFESAQIHYASCTGLTIILTDACRACGVPARMVGTPMWSDNSGNHTWTEVWDNQWHYVGSAEPDEAGLDHAWFTGNAAKADPVNDQHKIYAVSFQHTHLPWFLTLQADAGISALDVTPSYISRGTLSVKASGNSIEMRQGMILVAQSSAADATFTLAEGPTYTVAHVDAAGKILSSKNVKLNKDATTAIDMDR